MTIQEKKLKCSDNGGIHDIILRVQGKNVRAQEEANLSANSWVLTISISALFSVFLPTPEENI